jgi:uncharacterized OB-fold protein
VSAVLPERLGPTVTPDTRFFWDGLKDGRLLIQRCGGCGVLRHPPRPMCPHCRSLAWTPVESTGRGVVVSAVQPRHPRFPWFDDGYVVAIVELDDGIRLVTDLVDAPADTDPIGTRVAVRFAEFAGGLVLPLFAPEVAA